MRLRTEPLGVRKSPTPHAAAALRSVARAIASQFQASASFAVAPPVAAAPDVCSCGDCDLPALEDSLLFGLWLFYASGNFPGADKCQLSADKWKMKLPENNFNSPFMNCLQKFLSGPPDISRPQRHDQIAGRNHLKQSVFALFHTADITHVVMTEFLDLISQRIRSYPWNRLLVCEIDTGDQNGMAFVE